jgi:hypothetical protein
MSSGLRCALILSILFGLSPAYSQDKPGTVKVDSLPVYSRMSPDSDVVTTLARGTAVRILIAVTSDDGDWCSIASADGSSRIGYVPCSGLDRPKEILPASAQGGSRPQILIGGSFSPVRSAKRQAPEDEEGSAVGQTLRPIPGYNWGNHAETLVIAIRRGCPYCDASMPFYKRLGEQEQSNRIRAHVLLVMPDDASYGDSLLRKSDVQVQGLFGQDLGALMIEGTPTLLLLDSSGRIEREWVGQLPPAEEKDVMAAAAE